MRLKIASDDIIQAPPAGQPADPSNIPPPGKTPPKAAPAALQNTVSDQAILEPVAGTKISTLQSLGATPGAPGLSPASGASVSVGNMLDAKLAIELIDSVLPAVLVILMRYAGAVMKKTDLQLTEKEKGTLQPLVKACLDQLMINFNSPWVALGVTASIIYGAKLTEKGVIQILDNKAAKKELAKMEETAPANTVKENQGAPVITMKEAAKFVVDKEAPKKIDPTTVLWEPDNELIRAAVKRYRKSRKEAVIILKVMHAKGQELSPDKILKR